MRRLLLPIFFFFFISNLSFAQMIGTNIYLQGHWLEIGQENNGAFGTCVSPPAGYHPHCATCFPATGFAEVYDYGHDGWTVGAPTYMGDYTFPGSPFEGWELQINGARTQAFQSCPSGSYVGGLGMTGGSLSYSNTGGSAKGNWSGTATSGGATLSIQQETRVDTQASWVIVTTKFYNTSTTTTVNNVYYMRSCDPDNDETWPGGSFTTTNIIDYQQASDPDRRVQVRAYGGSATHPPLALCTKDCRAVAAIYGAWPLSSGQDLATIWAMTWTGGFYTLHGTDPGDIAIALVYNLGNIAPGDSTFISYAYTFDGISGIDSAFPEPILGVNGIPGIPSGVPPAPTYDTFNTCLFPGMTVLPVDLSSATTGVWTWSKWTWSPSTGLSATTGTSVTINTNVLPPSITYTITGTSTAACGTRVMYLTVLTCNNATVNSPCLGDSLIFNSPGDSLGATYVWVGPNSWTTTVATTQTFTVYPSTWADTGTYHVIKTVAGTSDTSSAVVVIHPKPVVTATSNSPLCITAPNTLTLFSNTDIPVTTYTWTGPSSFGSAIQNPTIPGFVGATDTGIYTVIVATSFGCKDTATTHVVVYPPPGAPIVTDPNPYCYGATFIPFTITAATGATVYWYPTAAGGAGTTTPPVVNTSLTGSYTFYFGQSIGLCASPIDSITIVVYPQVIADYTYTVSPGCVQDTVTFTHTSIGAFTNYTWNFGDLATSTELNPTHIYAQPGAMWNVVLTDYYNGCPGTHTDLPDTRHSVTAIFQPAPDSICVNTSSTMLNSSYAMYQGSPSTPVNYSWKFNDGTSVFNTSSIAAFGHTYNNPGIFPVQLIVTDNIGCTATYQQTVNVISISTTSWHDTTLCLKEPLKLTNVTYIDPFPHLVKDDPTYYYYDYSWSPSGGLSSSTVQMPFFDSIGTFTYTLTTTLWSHGTAPANLGCPAYDVYTIHSVLPKPLTFVTSNTTITYGTSIQLNADSATYYWWTPNNGTLDNPNINDPIATPDTTTTYMVIGLDEHGCYDTGFVTITVDSTMMELMPSGFTPNGDGLNDYFKPIGLAFRNMVDFRVYNRWGQQVFYTANVDSKGWDGTFNGVPQDIGTYFYTITIARPGGTGENVIYKGDVTLIR